jgi:hypothetical protein
VTTYRVGDATVTVGKRRVVTAYDDETFVYARPNHDTESYQRARSLGYPIGGATAAMTRDHDLLHSVLAIARGLPHSPTLWALAHGEPIDPAVSADEEKTVLLIQRLLNVGLHEVARG